MNADQHDAEHTASQALQGLIADYLEACERGEPVDRAALYAEHPDVAQCLAEFFADHDRMLAAGGLLPDSRAFAEDCWGEQPPRQGPSTQDLAPTLPASGVRDAAVHPRVRYVGDFELLDEISRGGMGVVYRARQLNLNRIVALKMILSGEMAGEEEVQRFHSEAEAAAHLDHPGIVPIYEIGEHLGQHYYAMGYVDGQSLAAQLQEHGPFAPEEAAGLLIKIATAVDYANSRGVIHRDLKPANILVDAEDHPRITDFGVAKRLDGGSELTRSGQILGTPAYMPPEQAACRFDEIGPTTDVYSLGAILYALLTGQAPFAASSPIDTLMQVLESEATLPSKKRPGIPPSLESICMKCLEKNPSKRYASAGELAADLRRFLNHEPVAVRPADLRQRLRRWGRREPALVVHLIGLTSVLITVQITYALIGTDSLYHARHTGLLIAWLAAVWGLQKLFNQPRWNELAARAWCIADSVFLTSLLCLAEPPIGPLLSGYPLLIVASGFLLRASLVIITTTTVVLCYLLLLSLCPELSPKPHYCVMYVLVILTVGGIVTAQVRRVCRLNRHFENLD